MSGPNLLKIKRKRHDLPPDALVVERPGKQQATEAHYLLRKEQLFESAGVEEPAQQQNCGASRALHVSGSGVNGAASGRPRSSEKRTFHLTRPSTPEAGVKKRRPKDDGVATFMERKAKRNAQDLMERAERQREDSIHKPEALKRAGRGYLMERNTSDTASGQASSSQDRIDPRMQAVADSLHEFAMAEVAKEATLKPKITARPKLPPQRSRELHHQRIIRSGTNGSVKTVNTDKDGEEDADYVYDTYVLAPTTDMGAAQVDAQDALGNVGYLVITEEDQAVWETYIEDDPSDKDWNSDEDDENAEDWYGADYPDDELASDDEFGRNAYGYRGHGASDDEEYDEDTGTWSEDEYERQMQPWRKKTPQQFSKYLAGGVPVDEDEEA